MVSLLFKRLLFIIRFLIFSKKGLLFLFQGCLNVAIMWNLKPFLLPYSAHIPSILIISNFWCSIPVFSMEYRWWTHVVVSSETPIHLVAIVFHLSVSPPSRKCLMRSAYSWTQNFLWSWGHGYYRPWGKTPPPTTLVSSLGSVSDCIGSWIQFPPLCWYQVYPTSWCWKTHSQ